MRWIVTLLVCAASAQPFGIPESIRQGNTLRLHGPSSAVSARLAERTVRLFPDAPTHGSFGLMPVAVAQKPGTYTLELLDASGHVVESHAIRILDAHFPRQYVTMTESVAELKPSPEESETVKVFRETVSPERFWQEPLELPIGGCLTSRFGVARWVNGKATGDFHGGIDQRGAAGTPIHAAAAGVVKIVREWNLHGRTVAIDHGQGLETIYLHMSKLAATEGATVKKGDVIGYVGSTGRSTGPHLHWSIYVNGIPVNPLDWVRVGPCSVPASKKKGE